MKKKMFILSTMLALSSVSTTYAWSIPGVTRPFDPGNYYSPTSISYADSRPSVFALREISMGNVYDYTRHIKSILFGNNLTSTGNTILARVLNNIQNMPKRNL